MSKANMTPFMHNVLDQFGDDNLARKVFHFALDKTGDILLAEKYAQEAMRLRELSSYLISLAAKNLAKQRPEFHEGAPHLCEEVLSFIMDRHKHMRLGQQAMGRR